MILRNPRLGCESLSGFGGRRGISSRLARDKCRPRREQRVSRSGPASATGLDPKTGLPLVGSGLAARLGDLPLERLVGSPSQVPSKTSATSASRSPRPPRACGLGHSGVFLGLGSSRHLGHLARRPVGGGEVIAHGHGVGVVSAQYPLLVGSSDSRCSRRPTATQAALDRWHGRSSRTHTHSRYSRSPGMPRAVSHRTLRSVAGRVGWSRGKTAGRLCGGRAGAGHD